jgi:hypothetical protein
MNPSFSRDVLQRVYTPEKPDQHGEFYNDQLNPLTRILDRSVGSILKVLTNRSEHNRSVRF